MALGQLLHLHGRQNVSLRTVAAQLQQHASSVQNAICFASQSVQIGACPSMLPAPLNRVLQEHRICASFHVFTALKQHSSSPWASPLRVYHVR